MRIGIITPFYYPNLGSGSEISVKLLVEKLVELNNDVKILTFDLDKKTSISEKVNGVHELRIIPLIRKVAFLTLTP